MISKQTNESAPFAPAKGARASEAMLAGYARRTHVIPDAGPTVIPAKAGIQRGRVRVNPPTPFN